MSSYSLNAPQRFRRAFWRKTPKPDLGQQGSVWQNCRQQGSREPSIPPHNSSQAHEILDVEPSASEWGPRKGFRNDKAWCFQHRAESSKRLLSYGNMSNEKRGLRKEAPLVFGDRLFARGHAFANIPVQSSRSLLGRFVGRPKPPQSAPACGVQKRKTAPMW